MFEQCITTIRSETPKKNWLAQIWVKRAKLGPKLIFLLFSQVWFFSFSLNYTEYKYVYYIL